MHLPLQHALGGRSQPGHPAAPQQQLERQVGAAQGRARALLHAAAAAELPVAGQQGLESRAGGGGRVMTQ